MQARDAVTYRKASINFPRVTARSERRKKEKHPSSKFVFPIEKAPGIKNEKPFFIL